MFRQVLSTFYWISHVFWINTLFFSSAKVSKRWHVLASRCPWHTRKLYLLSEDECPWNGSPYDTFAKVCLPKQMVWSCLPVWEVNIWAPPSFFKAFVVLCNRTRAPNDLAPFPLAKPWQCSVLCSSLSFIKTTLFCRLLMTFMTALATPWTL